MSQPFDYFIVFAEMRTGSNFLEENLNAIPGLRCWGEAFNPHFVGHAGKTAMAGVSIEQREADPLRLLAEMRRRTDGLAGFRFFHDHDPRILAAAVEDPRCAKVVLTRNPLDSYVSLQIARQTGQWRLGDLKGAKSARITFDPADFARHLDRGESFRAELSHRLQVSGQTAFHIGYDQIGDVEVVNGIARFLGVEGRLDRPSDKTKVQNPAGLRDKVENYDEMAQALSRLDPFGLSRAPGHEPRRGPAVRDHVTAARAPLVFMPVPGGPNGRVEAWLAALDGVEPAALGRGLSQKDMRRWKRKHPGHRGFTVIRHPLERAHAAFCEKLLLPGPAALEDLRATLRDRYALPIPEGAPGPDWDAAAHRQAFLAFLKFVKGNLGGQTSLKVEAAWASQTAVLQGMADFLLPDLVLREAELATALPALAESLGLQPPPLPEAAAPGPVPLAAIRDAEVEAAVRDIYQKDFVMFGFDPAG